MSETTSDLSNFDEEAEAALTAIETISQFINTWGNLVPGMGPHTHSLSEIKRNVSGALTLRGK